MQPRHVTARALAKYIRWARVWDDLTHSYISEVIHQWNFRAEFRPLTRVKVGMRPPSSSVQSKISIDVIHLENPNYLNVVGGCTLWSEAEYLCWRTMGVRIYVVCVIKFFVMVYHVQFVVIMKTIICSLQVFQTAGDECYTRRQKWPRGKWSDQKCKSRASIIFQPFPILWQTHIVGSCYGQGNLRQDHSVRLQKKIRRSNSSMVNAHILCRWSTMDSQRRYLSLSLTPVPLNVESTRYILLQFTKRMTPTCVILFPSGVMLLAGFLQIL